MSVRSPTTTRARARRTERPQASQEADQKAAKTREATAESLENFKKAFSVCLEAKNYRVKY